MNVFPSIAVLAAWIVTGPSAIAHEWTSRAQMEEAAQQVLASLSPDQRDAVRFPLDAPERGTWSNLPTLMVPPAGVLMKDMNDEQRRSVQALLRASMSSQGYAKFTGVMRLDDVLHEMAEARLDAMPVEERSPMAAVFVETRDATNYAIAFFGDPDSANWGWRLAGHHAAASFTVSEGRVAFSPR